MAANSSKNSLRAARFGDIWRGLNKRPDTGLRKFVFQRLSCILDGSTKFKSGINALIGANGTGKSTLVAAIGQLLSKTGQQERAGHRVRIAGSYLEGTFSHLGSDFTMVVEDLQLASESDDLDVELAWIDPSFSVEVLKPIHTGESFSELIRAHEAAVLSEDELATLTYLVGKDYSAVEIIEIDEYDDIGVFPYFRVTASGKSYDSRGMGQGELSLFLCFWALRRIEPNSVLIIEEPETHVSPKAQAAFLDILARTALEKSLWIVITTHSPSIVRKLPASHIKYISQHAGNSILIENASRLQIEALLGEAIRFQGGFVVEDMGACAFVEVLVEKFSPALRWTYDTFVAGGEGEVQKLIAGLPSGLSWLNVIAIFDGDQRQRLKAYNFAVPTIFLPGDTDPDALCKAEFSGNDARALLASVTGRDETACHLALSYASGSDYHDWVQALNTVLKIDVRVLRRALVVGWLSRESNSAQAREFVMDLEKLIPNPE